MSGVKHTPGRWKLDVLPPGGPFGAAAGRAYGVSSTNALGLSVPVVVWRGIARPASPEGQANARLIAAAPDLLAALAEMEAACERIASERSPQVYGLMIEQGQSGNLLALDEARRASRAAIARARGEQAPNHSDQKEVGNG